MMYKAILLILMINIFCSVSARSSIGNPFKPCQIGDQACFDTLSNFVKPIVFGNIPEIGVESSDPMFIREIVGDSAGLKYKLNNCTWTGFSNCVVSNVIINENITNMQYDMDCPSLSLVGKYEINGVVGPFHAEGKGDFKVISGKYNLHYESDMVKYKGPDGKTHAALENINLECVPITPITFDFKNMFNGQKELSETFHKYLHENWKQIAELFQTPVFNTCIGKVIENANKYLQLISLENFIIL